MKEELFLALTKLLTEDVPSAEHLVHTLAPFGVFREDFFTFFLTSPVDVTAELCRLPKADFPLVCAILTLLIQQARYDEAAFDTRLSRGEIHLVLRRMRCALMRKPGFGPPLKPRIELGFPKRPST